jgi:hypothetical protein
MLGRTTPPNRSGCIAGKCHAVRHARRKGIPARRRLGLFFDPFNITNSNAAQTLDNVTGRRTTTVDGASVEYQRFLRPTVILAPRVYRFGIKMDF